MAVITFEKGDFVTWINKPGCFGIYEGINIGGDTTYSKKYSLAVFFDPSKYTETENGYKNVPFLDVATNIKRVEKTIDTDREDYWWHKATELQKRNAIETLAEWGYAWDEETLSIIDVETGEIVKRIVIPKIEYNGEVIKPMCESFKDKLIDFVKSKNKATTAYQGQNSNYPYWQRGEEDWESYYD